MNGYLIRQQFLDRCNNSMSKDFHEESKSIAEVEKTDGGVGPFSIMQEWTCTGVDMNPAHIIRECLTNKSWGLGYNS
jgi:hypothetical protein